LVAGDAVPIGIARWMKPLVERRAELCELLKVEMRQRRADDESSRAVG
jgi:hypothetical protein